MCKKEMKYDIKKTTSWYGYSYYNNYVSVILNYSTFALCASIYGGA